MLSGKKVLLGVCGSIAAYKIATLVRLLVKAEAEVRIIMTPSASAFIGPVTLATLSKNPVLIDFIKNEQGEWNNHVELGLWADLFLIAPASANTLAKMANGLCDNLLLATYLSARCPVILAPAMDLDMYRHPGTKQNLEKLASFGHTIIEPEEGELASGLSGKGRMAEPESLFSHIETFFKPAVQELKGKRVLITAGPTYEAIDPVRFIGNHSSGKMGFALATSCLEQGAEVVLISGPVALPTPHGVKLIKVNSAKEMLQACLTHFAESEVSILAAAVADYAPKEIAEHKIKKGEENLLIELVKNPDIAARLAALKSEKQIVVGFALETENELENARLKLERKNFDFIVLNSLNDENSAFGMDTNKITLISKSEEKALPLLSKANAAREIVAQICRILG
jgi:phosphopantothenoylcysteine decarboxylase / phosphopantothenate---cysteine ligase